MRQIASKVTRHGYTLVYPADGPEAETWPGARFAGRLGRQRGPPYLCASGGWRRFATHHSQLLRRVAFTLGLDVRSALIDRPQIALGQIDAGGTDVFFQPMELSRPGVGTM